MSGLVGRRSPFGAVLFVLIERENSGHRQPLLARLGGRERRLVARHLGFPFVDPRFGGAGPRKVLVGVDDHHHVRRDPPDLHLEDALGPNVGEDLGPDPARLMTPFVSGDEFGVVDEIQRKTETVQAQADRPDLKPARRFRRWLSTVAFLAVKLYACFLCETSMHMWGDARAGCQAAFGAFKG